MTLSFCDLDWVHKILESFEKKNILVPKQWTLYMMNLTQLDTGGHKLILGFSWSTDKTGVLSLGTSKETSPWIPTIQFTSSQTGGLGPRLDLIHSMIRNAMWKVWLWEPTMSGYLTSGHERDRPTSWVIIWSFWWKNETLVVPLVRVLGCLGLYFGGPFSGVVPLARWSL